MITIMRLIQNLKIIFIIISFDLICHAQIPTIFFPKGVKIIREGEPVYLFPQKELTRIGILGQNNVFKLSEAMSAQSCNSLWYRIGNIGWVCGEHVELVNEPLITFDYANYSDETLCSEKQIESLPYYSRIKQNCDLLPGVYGFVAKDGADLYGTLYDAEMNDWVKQLDPGMGLRVVKMVKNDNSQFWQTSDGYYVNSKQFIISNPLMFKGINYDKSWTEKGYIPAWTTGAEIVSCVKKGGTKRNVIKEYTKQSFILIKNESLNNQLVQVDEECFIQKKMIKYWEREVKPESVKSEKWIDINLKQQILTAYDNNEPFYITLVSTGRQSNETPKGIFKVWAKLIYSTMDGEPETIDEQAYLIQDVPWTLYFNESYAIHAAFWHNKFGQKRSHGCVNLSPSDAKIIFNWSNPQIPTGWKAILPYDDNTTYVYVH